MAEDIFQRLKKNEWDFSKGNSHSFGRADITTNPISIVALEKTYGDGLSVTVSIHEQGSHFIVVSSAEHRCSGPSENVIGTADSHDDAMAIASGCCNEWDAEEQSTAQVTDSNGQVTPHLS